MHREFPLIAVACGLLQATNAFAIDAAFVQIVHDPGGASETRMHIGELEVFIDATVPDELGGGDPQITFNTSSNDLGGLVTYDDGAGNILPSVGTWSGGQIQHGGANVNPNNVLEQAGAVWSTAPSQATRPQYTLNLDGSVDVTTVRVFPRADNCCIERFTNLQVNLLADDGFGAPGAVVATISGLGPDPDPGGNPQDVLELTYASASAEVAEIAFEPSLTFPDLESAVTLSSAALGKSIGLLSALSEVGSQLTQGIVFSLVAGTGDTDNASYSMGGANGDELLVNASLLGLDDTPHSVRVRAENGEGSFDMAFAFTVKLDSDADELIDDWETMFGTLADFAPGADKDADDLDDEVEFTLGTDPSDDDSDDDGSKDGAEIANMTDPLEEDTDGDGLNDGDEATAGADPLVTDTDGDNLSDGSEVDANPFSTDPTKQDTDGDGVNDDVEINLWSDDGTGNPGAILATVEAPEQHPHGDAGPLEVSFEIIPVVPLAITDFAITLDPADPALDLFSLTWNSIPDRIYGLFYSTDLASFDADIDDSIDSEGTSTSAEFQRSQLPEDIRSNPDLFFNVKDLGSANGP